jgi:hypothetical protein
VSQEPKACTIVLRGASKDVLNEVERNLHVSCKQMHACGFMQSDTCRESSCYVSADPVLFGDMAAPHSARAFPLTPRLLLLLLQDAMGVARNIIITPRLVPGGGAVEMAVSRALTGGGCCFIHY